ncbi:Rab family GTPase [Sporobolomyces salmoneus]|uniref:Rab family GTPase n=1 Tax=Sporobolomyces salmoneus TaxID=183962 RepID=UPI00317DC510
MSPPPSPPPPLSTPSPFSPDATQSPSRPPLKLVLLGPTSSGKTALRRRFIAGDFVGNYRATIGTDFLTKTISLPPSGGGNSTPRKEVELALWDTAGQERFKSISAPFYRGALAAVLAFDYTTSPSTTLEQLRVWFNEFERNCREVKEMKEFCWCFVGCKMDLVSEEERKRVEKEVKREVRGWFTAERTEEEQDGVKGIDFEGKRKKKKPKTRVEISPLPIPTPSSSSSSTSPTPPPRNDSDAHSTETITPTPQPRPPLSSRTPSTTSTIASVELSSSIPNPHILNPRSVLLMSTSPPKAPESVSLVPEGGHPKAIYRGGPFSIEGRLLENDQEHGEQGETEGYKVDGDGEPEQDRDGEQEEGKEEEFGSFKLFSTSAKTGEGVQEVFEYCARRILHNLSLEDEGSNRNGNQGDVIKVNDRDLSRAQKWRRACCS